MLSSTHKLGGRAWSVAVWTIGLSTIVIMTVLLLWSWSPVASRSWLALAEIVGSYMVAIGIIGAASQAGNAAERLPGVREFRSQHRGHGQDRRSTDGETDNDIPEAS